MATTARQLLPTVRFLLMARYLLDRDAALGTSMLLDHAGAYNRLANRKGGGSVELFGIDKPRRIVTGLRPDGTSDFARVEEVQPIDTDTVFAGRSKPDGGPEVHRMWAWDELPTLPVDGLTAAVDPAPQPDETPDALRRTTPLPEEGGVRVNLIKYPPHDPAAPAASPRFAWHDTIDFQFLVAGELVIRVDDGSELTLRPGDLVVQNGANRAWEARSETGAILAVVINGARRSGASPPPESQNTTARGWAPRTEG
jgi:hypothetical protein